MAGRRAVLPVAIPGGPQLVCIRICGDASAGMWVQGRASPDEARPERGTANSEVDGWKNWLQDPKGGIALA